MCHGIRISGVKGQGAFESVLGLRKAALTEHFIADIAIGGCELANCERREFIIGVFIDELFVRADGGVELRLRELVVSDLVKASGTRRSFGQRWTNSWNKASDFAVSPSL